MTSSLFRQDGIDPNFPSFFLISTIIDDKFWEWHKGQSPVTSEK